MNDRFFLHSAIPYVNAAPHLGHALEFVQADALRRFQVLQKGADNVRYLCGADENGLKILQAAHAAGIDPQTFINTHQQEFLDLAELLNVQFDIWQRGSDRKHHVPASQKLWHLCDAHGDVYKKTYTGRYCVGCELFYEKNELDTNGQCFEHPGKPLEEVSEENYFFRLSRYQSFLDRLIATDELKITPAARKREALAFIRRGLKDFSISRSVTRAKNWGVPVPDDPDQIMYVWFDALNIYQSGIGFGWDQPQYQRWWPPEVMMIGKGILRFHAVYWPAILQSAKLQIAKQLFVHGYITSEGQKMSKSVGNVVDPTALVKKYGTDPVRYYLLREIPAHGDGDFSESRFTQLYNADLANGLGNLVSRVASLCEKNTFDPTLLRHRHRNRVMQEITPSFASFRFDAALEHIWKGITALDRYIETQRPWEKTEKEARHALKTIVAGSEKIASLLEIAAALKPFLPDTAKRIEQQFSNRAIKTEKPLFPRLS